MTATLQADVSARAARVRLMIFDIDGVMTDGSLHYATEGETLKTFHVHDGLGIKLLQQSGVPTAIITARQSEIITKRAKDLGIKHVMQGVHDKRAGFEALLAKTGLTADECGFLGDDWIDLPVLTRVGFAASVPNGRAEVQARVHFVTQARGGHGAVRELCDLIMRAQGTYEAALAPYLI
jgi:3-deoxy-D-manno-octulosonate 8-phosphate phosphatase (KDO 8-P phosphatase)